MFEQVSLRIYNLLSNMALFTDVMEHSGELQLYPIAAPESAQFPLTIYIVGEQTPATKDQNQLSVDVAFWFGNSGSDYKRCCTFLDDVLEQMANENDLYFESASVDFNDEFLSYSGLIRIKVGLNN